jgi:hypothetical protein
MVFMVDSREIPLQHLGQNGSFWQPGIGGDFGVAERREADGEVKRRTVRGGRAVVFQGVTSRSRTVRRIGAHSGFTVLSIISIT